MTAAQYRFVIVGGGMAGGRAAAALAGASQPGTVALVGAEPDPPYERPPLSKHYLTAQQPAEPWLRVGRRGRAPDLLLDVAATSLDTPCRELLLADGRTVAYENLLLATGARARRLPVPGGDLPGVHYLRSLEDARRLRVALRRARRVVIVGAGFVGLEVASSTRALGLATVVIEALEHPVERSLGRQVGSRLATILTSAGVELLTGTTVRTFVAGPTGRVGSVVTDHGEVPADVVVVAVGAATNTEWLAGSGVNVDGGGVVVDEYCRTSAAGVWAAGDIARYLDADSGRYLRVEHESHAQGHAMTAARNMLGQRGSYRAVPFVWSEQFGHYLWSVGLPGDADRTVTVDNVGSAGFLALHTAEERLVAVTGLDGAALLPQARAQVKSGAVVSSIEKAVTSVTG